MPSDATSTVAPVEPSSFELMKQKYLLCYNAMSCGAWAYITYKVATNGYANHKENYEDIGDYLLVTQSFAVLEILHSLVGLVRSPVLTTSLQVASRLIMVWLVCDAFPTVTSHIAYSTMAIAWGITEIIRYAYYCMNMVNMDNDYFWFVTFCRYHFFYILYPVGAYSEYLLIQAAHEIAKKDPAHEQLATALNIFTWIWPPGFFVMYTHMQGQRRKFILSGKLDEKEAREGAGAEKKDN
ncbi:tyrosine phosphatase-like protein [Chytriomyces sp. MP71]|nr:tyrosine phosphatase-like protein [Chytriomyces sp. MP71]